MSRTYNEIGLLFSNAGYDYSGRTTISRTANNGAGTGSSNSTRVITRLRTATASGTGTSGGTATFVSKGSFVSGLLAAVIKNQSQ